MKYKKKKSTCHPHIFNRPTSSIMTDIALNLQEINIATNGAHVTAITETCNVKAGTSYAVRLPNYAIKDTILVQKNGETPVSFQRVEEQRRLKRRPKTSAECVVAKYPDGYTLELPTTSGLPVSIAQLNPKAVGKIFERGGKRRVAICNVEKLFNDGEFEFDDPLPDYETTVDACIIRFDADHTEENVYYKVNFSTNAWKVRFQTRFEYDTTKTEDKAYVRIGGKFSLSEIDGVLHPIPAEVKIKVHGQDLGRIPQPISKGRSRGGAEENENEVVGSTDPDKFLTSYFFQHEFKTPVTNSDNLFWLKTVQVDARRHVGLSDGVLYPGVEFTNTTDTPIPNGDTTISFKGTSDQKMSGFYGLAINQKFEYLQKQTTTFGKVTRTTINFSARPPWPLKFSTNCYTTKEANKPVANPSTEKVLGKGSIQIRTTDHEILINVNTPAVSPKVMLDQDYPLLKF